MNGQCIPDIRLRRSAKAKHLRLVIKPGAIELVAPLAASERQVLAFLQRHRPWAERKFHEVHARSAPDYVPGLLDAGATLPWRGRDIPLMIDEGKGRRVSVAIDEAARITVPEGLGAEREAVVKHALFLWVRRWLQREVGELAAHHGVRHDLRPREIRIKRMTTRWGSCGPRNDLNINWLLAFVPETVLEYVIIHELCHIRERNHSAAFWALVGEHCPDYARERAWLKSRGTALIQRYSG